MSFTTTSKPTPIAVLATLSRRVDRWLQHETLTFAGAITRKNTILAQAIIAAIVAAPLTALASEAELLQRIDKLAAELEQVKAELLATRRKTDTVEKRQDALAATAPASPISASGSNVQVGAQTVITGYGEVNYNRPSKDPSQAQVDVRRAVIGFQHRFDDKTKLVTEFEWEHAVTSATDQGEAAVEQLYIEREFNNGLRAKAGLFLIPAGLLNTSHEPTAYYGVERNFVETAIIPSTWREAGLGLSSTMDNGLTWDVGLTTGFDLTKWDPASADGRDSPLGSIHQEGQLAKARNLSVYGALNWRGVPGLLLGGSVFTGKAGHGTADFAAPDARITLGDLHARYTPGKWDLSAVYARGTISNTDALNAAFAADPTPVPSSFSGWYALAAYKVWKSGNYALTPFVRYEEFNTAKSYSGVSSGVPTGPDEKVVTLGAGLNLTEGVILKADYQKFKSDNSRDRLNLGVGFSF